MIMDGVGYNQSRHLPKHHPLSFCRIHLGNEGKEEEEKEKEAWMQSR